MTPTRDVPTVVTVQDLPLELRRQSKPRPVETRIASILSGTIAPRQPDDVICPMLLRRNLVFPVVPADDLEAVSTH